MANIQNGLHKIVEQMIERMESGVGSWMKSWSAPNGFPMNFVTKKEYRGFNFFYLSSVMEERGYKAPYFLTFNQAKALGGNVKKGAKSVSIYFYKMSNYTKEMEDVSSGELTMITKTIPILKEYKVFNIQDCDNIEYTIPEATKNDNQRYTNFESFIGSVGADIRFGGNRAFYRATDDFIQMPELEYFVDTDNYCATMLHELTHWSGAKHRLDRLKAGSFGSKNYAFEELVAELGSVFLCSHLGINIENNQHPEYLQSWIASLRENPQILWRAASQAQEAFDYIKGLSGELVLIDEEAAVA